MSRPRVIIVGAGVAGLAAALRLGEGGRYEPLVIERDGAPGGLARCLRFKGAVSDMGPHRIHTEIPGVMEVIEQVAAPSLITVKRESHIFLRGHYLPYPPSPWAMTRRLGPLNMARFGASFFFNRMTPHAGPETYESLMKDSFGPALYDFLLKPYSAKTWKCDPAEIHADTARVRVSAGSLAKMIKGIFVSERKGGETSLKEFKYVRGGIETLVRHLRESAEGAGARVELDCEATGFERGGDGAIRAVKTKDGRTIEGDAFISTAPLPALLGGMLPAAPDLDAARQAAEGLEYINIVFVLAIVKRSSLGADNWLYFPEPDLVFNRAYEAKNMDRSMGPEDRTVICIEITARPDSSLWREGDEALAGRALDQIAATGLLGRDEVEETHVHRLEFAYPVYALDYDTRLDAALEGLRRVPNLMTCGRQGLFNHNNMDHSIHMGLTAADCLTGAETPAAASAAWYGRAGEFKRLRIVD